MEAALNRKQKQIDNFRSENKDIEIKYITARDESAGLSKNVKVKTVKLVQKVEKIMQIKKEHKAQKTQLKEEKKEVKGKLTEANNILKLLKKGLISIADI